MARKPNSVVRNKLPLKTLANLQQLKVYKGANLNRVRPGAPCWFQKPMALWRQRRTSDARKNARFSFGVDTRGTF